ncbi:hypothetical protein AAG570_012357, partial [Ranatra chinensis]
SRRSHERSFGSGGNDYAQSRSYYIGDKGGGGYGGSGSDKGSYREIRESRPSADYSFRKPSMPSPRSPRGARGRGYGRSSLIATASGGFLTRKRAALGESYVAMRKRYLPTKSQDYLRRLKLYRLKSRRFKDDEIKDKKSDDEEEDDDGDIEDKENDEEEDEEEGEGEGSSQDGNEGEEKEENAIERENKEEEEEGADETEDKEKPAKKKEVKKPVKKAVKKATSTATATSSKKKSEEGKRESGVEDPETPLTNYLGQPYIRLKCPHCNYTCVTFKEYGYHLGLKKHQIAMRSLSTRLRATLARMRIEQRQKQRLLDEECKAQGNIHLRTFFCNICKLNYRTLKSQHQSTLAHKKMREFLLPFCRICRLTYKSPMLYEAHICDLSHIKRKARLEKLKAPLKEEDEDIDSGNELDTNSFMILDAVGSGEKSEGNEEIEEEKSEGEKKKEETPQKKKKKKSEIKLGAEYCKLVEVYYCELCKTYLPRLDDKKRAVTIHCRSRAHLQRWTRDIKIVRRKGLQLNKERVKQEKKDEENEEESIKVQNRKKFSDGTMDMDVKMWSVVDKDLTELLNEAEEEATKSSDEDDDSRADGGRYDRFKHSDKNIDKSSEMQKDMKKVDEVDSEESKREKRSGKSGGGQSNGAVSPSEKKKIDDTKAEK